MAQQDYTGLIMLAAIGGVAYYGYQQGWFTGLFPSTTAAAAPVASPVAVVSNPSQSAPVTAATAPVTTPPAPSTSNATAEQISSAIQLVVAAGSQSTFNADQWEFYWNKLGWPAIPSSISNVAFWPNGRPASTSDYTQYSALQFIIALENAGGATPAQLQALQTSLLQGNGLGNYHGVPVRAIHGGW